MDRKETKKSMKKTKIILSVFIVALLIITSVLVIIFFPVIKWEYYEHTTWKGYPEYEQYADDFNLVKDYFLTEFPDEHDRRYISISYNVEKGLRLYDGGAKEYLTDVPDNVISSLEIIKKEAFSNPNEPLEDIEIDEGRIAFASTTGLYSFVYSPDKKPTWLHSRDEDFLIQVKKVQDGWYHVRKW